MNWNLIKLIYQGSYAKGREKEDSDIDIAVILGNMIDFFEARMLLMRFSRKIDLRIEPHPICESDFINVNPLAFEIQYLESELRISDHSSKT